MQLGEYSTGYYDQLSTLLPLKMGLEVFERFQTYLERAERFRTDPDYSSYSSRYPYLRQHRLSPMLTIRHSAVLIHSLTRSRTPTQGLGALRPNTVMIGWPSDVVSLKVCRNVIPTLKYMCINPARSYVISSREVRIS